MAIMVIEVPAELKALGEAMVDAMAAVTKARAGTMGWSKRPSGRRRSESSEQDTRVLGSLDVDEPSVMIGGARFTRVGRSEATWRTAANPSGQWSVSARVTLRV